MRIPLSKLLFQHVINLHRRHDSSPAERAAASVAAHYWSAQFDAEYDRRAKR